uniref:Uncharacterized protein n=1 Tax=Anopheles quadriannulatus TaxID=34691 RepID=A0A182XQV7_ANOQN
MFRCLWKDGGNVRNVNTHHHAAALVLLHHRAQITITLILVFNYT